MPQPRNTGSRQTLNTREEVPISLRLVSEEEIIIKNHVDASNFLGVQTALLTNYIKAKTQVIKSAIDGKTYMIRRAKKQK
jgi:hypothetical protein